MSDSRTRTPPRRPRHGEARPVSQPHDRHEQEADRAAAEVARGRSVAGWSFSAVPASSAPVQRQGTGKKPQQKSEDDKKKEALLKVGEAVLQTKAGKELTDKVLADPGVKKLKDFATSPGGIAVESALGLGAVTALGAAHQPLPFQPPAIPLDKITPGLSAQLTYQGPVDRPTFVGITLIFKEQAPKGKKGPTESERYRAETARIAAANQEFLRHVTYAPGSEQAEEQRAVQEALAKVTGGGDLPGFTIPLTPPAKKDESKQPVQPAPASPSSAPPPAAYVDAALATPGRPLDPPTRRSMESHFGYDFGGVRVHDDGRAAETAAVVDAAAFTVGDQIVFGAGRFEPSSADGRTLLAHELTHVVQQRGAGAARMQRDGGSQPVPATTLEALPEADRKRIKAVTTTHVTVSGLPGLFATSGTTTTLPLPSRTAAVFDASVDAGLRHGLSNVAGALTTTVQLSPPPLPPNGTVTLELDVPGSGKGLYRFTYDAPPARGAHVPASTSRILVESLGRATAPPGTTPPQPAAPGARAAADPVADKIARHHFSQSYAGTELDALRAAIAQVPDAQLSIVDGLAFRRDHVHPTKPDEAGHYDPKTHTITMYDLAFAGSQTRVKGAGPVESGDATRAIVHELGHAIDLAPMRQAEVGRKRADAAVAQLPSRFPNPSDPTAWQWHGRQEKAQIDAVLAAQKAAEAKVLSTTSLSGTTTRKDRSGGFVDVIGTAVGRNAFRQAQAKDGTAVSKYGEQDFQEAFAEAYSLYITSPQTLKALRPHVYDFLDRSLPK